MITFGDYLRDIATIPDEYKNSPCKNIMVIEGKNGLVVMTEDGSLRMMAFSKGQWIPWVDLE